MTVTIRGFGPDDIEPVLHIWRLSDHIGLDESDSIEHLRRFLAHNPDCNFVAAYDECVVGAVLCGNDGRRGYLYHLAVDRDHRRRGIGRKLVQRVCAGLRAGGIHKCHIHIFKNSEFADLFWEGLGWNVRCDIDIRSKFT